MLQISQFEEVTQIRMCRQIEGSLPYWVAAYLVDGLLIDAGCSYNSKELTAELEGKKLRTVINTHYHEDHIGANHDLVNAFGVDIYAHPDSIPLIAKRHKLYPYQETLFGYPVPTRVSPVPAVLKTDRFIFEILSTPGHCAGHICSMERSKGWCFTGDLFARTDPKIIRKEENLGEVIGSMRRVLEASGSRLVLFTGVGKIVADGKKALCDCIDYLTDFAGQAREMKRLGLGTDAIVKGLFGAEHPFALLTQGQVSTYNLVESLIETVS
jgi:glyoxylase-like metal-dependent hydrolase (beta-lactamase superfamily II)